MGWWSAGGVEREKRYGLFVGASGCALNEADKSGRADEPERNENRGEEIRRSPRHERREDDEDDAEDGDRLTCSAHLTSDTSIRWLERCVFLMCGAGGGNRTHTER